MSLLDLNISNILSVTTYPPTAFPEASKTPIKPIVLVGAIIALGLADNTLEKTIGFIGVLLASGNAVGGYVVTERMLEMFKSSKDNDKP